MIDFYFKSITGFIYQDNYKDSIEEILIMLYPASSASWSNHILNKETIVNISQILLCISQTSIIQYNLTCYQTDTKHFPDKLTI